MNFASTFLEIEMEKLKKENKEMYYASLKFGPIGNWPKSPTCHELALTFTMNHKVIYSISAVFTCTFTAYMLLQNISHDQMSLE